MKRDEKMHPASLPNFFFHRGIHMHWHLMHEERLQ